MTERVRYRRAYDLVHPDDGARILVDRLWPRGIRKETLDLTAWLRDIAPSPELRKWYGHQPDLFPEFRRRYLAELTDADHAAAADQLREYAERGPVTLLTGSKAVDISDAAVLAEWLTGSSSAS
ncbi:DUF488 domain-containing protein [Nocardia stercoris]|uniref:DUF488 family protein n=1 Tax=Nocardia stercoris TaxID=2483361 RepID=A0A3M2LDM7_9NOCA|nr:DUF488 family protein [Nocardia stercoris]RMI35514.1 DUF488 family protein [Nocardia stercoris]